jgi:U3 small nucleolar RNA-associated protein 3
MTEADFGFDESEWLDAVPEDEEGDVVTEVLKDVEITADMGPEERLRILKTRYPEFEFLANEFIALQPVLGELQKDMEIEKTVPGQTSVTVVKCRALAAYMASLSMYFALLTSPAKDTTTAQTMDPSELRDHPVMDSLLQCRTLWSKVKSLKTPAPISLESENDSDSDSSPEEITTKIPTQKPTPPKQTTKALARARAATEAATLRAQKLAAADESLADLNSLLPTSRPKKPIKTLFPSESDDNTNDFGEATHLISLEASQKAASKKSLKFYTSQITQKANKRAGAGREAGGDTDLPYKERMRDRVARLNAEAERRGKKLDSYGRGVDLGDGSGDEQDETAVAREVKEDGDNEYYDLVSKSAKGKRIAKAETALALAAAQSASALDRVEQEADEEGKRAIGYVIEKNKGLAPKRKKDVRNPRVKKRKKFEERKKKLRSMKAVWKGGEERGGYKGEMTGIKSGLVKSVKL